MAKKRFTLLNVKKYIESVVRSSDMMIEDHKKKWPGGIVLPPAYISDLAEISLIGRAILKKHAEKKTRKDVYVGA